MNNNSYQYVEKPAGEMLGRRGFMKVVGVMVAAVAVAGYGITELILKRSAIIKARQKGLYDDDLRLQKQKLTSSHDNPSVRQMYSDLKAKPVEGVMYELTHTHYVARNNLAAIGAKHV